MEQHVTHRASVVVPGLDHGASPFPVATRTGPFVFSSALSGRDPETGELSPDLATQATTAFANVRRVVEAAGLTVEAIVKVTVHAADRAAVRSAIDDPWVELFPDHASRPVRHTVAGELPPGFHLQVEFIAVQEDHQ